MKEGIAKMGTITQGAKQLVIAGAILFLLGLIQGAAVPYFFNPRMALSAHLTAVQGGTAIMVVGAVWGWIDLSVLWDRIGRWAVVGGMVGLWLALTLSAASGASQSLPIAVEGYRASEAMETVVSVAVAGASALLIAGWTIFTIGLIRKKMP